MKTYQHDYYITLLCFDSMLSYNTSVQNDIVMTTAKQNQKFPFHFFFRFAVEGWGEETRGKCKEIFWFLHTRVRERVRGALVRITTQSERTRQFQATTRSARAKSGVLLEMGSNFFKQTPLLRQGFAVQALAREGCSH